MVQERPSRPLYGLAASCLPAIPLPVSLGLKRSLMSNKDKQHTRLVIVYCVGASLALQLSARS